MVGVLPLLLLIRVPSEEKVTHLKTGTGTRSNALTLICTPHSLLELPDLRDFNSQQAKFGVQIGTRIVEVKTQMTDLFVVSYRIPIWSI